MSIADDQAMLAALVPPPGMTAAVVYDFDSGTNPDDSSDRDVCWFTSDLQGGVSSYVASTRRAVLYQLELDGTWTAQ